MFQPSKQAQSKQLLSEGTTMATESWSQWSLGVVSSWGYSVIHPLPVLLERTAYLILKVLSSLKFKNQLWLQHSPPHCHHYKRMLCWDTSLEVFWHSWSKNIPVNYPDLWMQQNIHWSRIIFTVLCIPWEKNRCHFSFSLWLTYIHFSKTLMSVYKLNM